MSFKQEVLDHYMDKDLLVTIDRDPTPWSTGNGLLYTGLFYVICRLRGEINADDVERFTKAVNSCRVDGYDGLFHRNPQRNTDLQAHDDYIGIAAGSYFLRTSHALDIVRHGENNCWSFNNLHPERWGFQTYQDRFPGLIAFYKMCTGEVPGLFRRIGLNSMIRGNAESAKGDAGGKIMMWLKTRVAKDMKILPQAIELWENEVIKDYGSINGLFAAYFGSNHPFAKAFD